ncbi:uncharacterized protein JCM6883_002548 [Sporobolomyces salmoneus]|uniref:uncharacterized protein n=1 Tax=Sporobolomyces salmoneus TaxID=183962 RepID=UPI00316BA3EE
MNFFRRAQPPAPTVKEPPADPPPATARQEKERRWMSTISSGKEQRGSRDTKRTEEESAGSRQRELSNGASSRGKWLNPNPNPSTNNVEEPRMTTSSQASIRSKRSFFKSKDKSSVIDQTTLSSSTSPSANSNPTLSPSLATSSPEIDHSRPTRTNQETKTLATRLQELAIANADGLLDDEEYRLLRRQVFETHSSKNQAETSMTRLSEGTEAVPRFTGNLRSPRSRESSSIRMSTFVMSNGPRAMTPSTPPDNYTETLASPVSSPPRAPSVASYHSKRHSILPPLNSLFRREASSSAASLLDADWDVVTPPLSSPNDYPRSASPLPRPSDSVSVRSGRSKQLSPPTSPARNRTIRNHPGLASSTMDSRSSTYFAGGGGSSRSSNGGRSSFAGGGGGGGGIRSGESVFSSGSRSNNHAPRSPTSLRTRSYYSGGGGGGPSSALSHGGGYSSTHSHDRGSGVETLLSHSLPPITSSTDPLLFAATGREPTAQELEREIREIEGEWERMKESWKGLERGRIQDWERQVGGTVVKQVREMARREREQRQMSQEKVEKKDEGQIAKKGIFRRASFLPSSQRATATPATIEQSRITTTSTLSDPPLPQFLLSSKIPLPTEFESNLSPHLLEPTLALRISMEELLDRQRRTEEKYERRLEFLRAKEKGARIRDGLLK